VPDEDAVSKGFVEGASLALARAVEVPRLRSFAFVAEVLRNRTKRLVAIVTTMPLFPPS
jgi:hypothetical protein